jgi:hypothetical protein
MKQCKKPKMRMWDEKAGSDTSSKKTSIFLKKKNHQCNTKKMEREINSKSISCFFGGGGGGSFAVTRRWVVPFVGRHSLTKTRMKRTPQREAYRAFGPAQSPYGRAYAGPGYHAD